MKLNKRRRDIPENVPYNARLKANLMNVNSTRHAASVLDFRKNNRSNSQNNFEGNQSTKSLSHKRKIMMESDVLDAYGNKTLKIQTPN